MLRLVQHAGGRTLLDDATLVQHDDLVAQALHDAEVVGDEHDRRALVRPEARQHRQDLRPHRDVERRERLVAHEQAGPVCEGTRERDALPLAAGELVRIAPRRLRIEADLREHLADARAVVAADPQRPERLGDDPLHRHPRIERGVRILEDDTRLAAQPAQPS